VRQDHRDLRLVADDINLRVNAHEEGERLSFRVTVRREANEVQRNCARDEIFNKIISRVRS
jgi:hypothetical protein